jgi:amino acid transporter
MNDSIKKSESLKRQLTVIGLWLLAINGMIGAGIFGVPAKTFALAGEFSPWIFVICAVLIAPIMLSFGELASSFRSTGGPMLFVGMAFGPFAGFQAGWAYYVARITAYSANMNLMVLSVGYFWPDAAEPVPRIILIGVASAVIIGLNVVNAKATMGYLGIITLIKLTPLIALALYGLISWDGSAVTSLNAVPDPTNFGAALLLVIYAYVGFESSTVPAGESKNPQRDMHRALVMALVVATALYALIQLATQQLVPDLALNGGPLLAAGEAWLGPIGASIVALGIVTSVGGNLISSTFSSARISYRMGLDGYLPKWFAAVNVNYATPIYSVLFFGIAGFFLSASGSFVYLAVLSVFTRLLMYIVCIISMPAVRRNGDQNAYRLPGGWFIPGSAILVCLGLLSQVSWTSVLATMSLLAIGSVLYVTAKWAQSRKN